MLPEALAKSIFVICLGLHGPGESDLKHDCFEDLNNCAVETGGTIPREKFVNVCLPKVLEPK